jgi:hypothetical protein
MRPREIGPATVRIRPSAAQPAHGGDAVGRGRPIHQIPAMTGHHGLADPYRVRTPPHPPGPWPAEVLLDDLLTVYVEWRETARTVAEAYARWSLASGSERAMRFAAYTATLDQEQKTAAAYAETVTDVKRWLERSRSTEGSEHGSSARASTTAGPRSDSAPAEAH